MLNLYDYLTPLDNKRIHNYIKLYGVNSDYVGNDIWLSDWKENKKKLFRLLGGNLIYKIPYSYEKDKENLNLEIKELLDSHPFFDYYHTSLYKLKKITREEEYSEEEYEEFRDFYFQCCYLPNINSLNNNEIYLSRNLKYKNKKTNKTLQLSSKAKTMKSIQKVINFFFPDDEKMKTLFEDMRIKHSMILNDKYVKGQLCFSIHPLDFMTMSDNDSNWSSCMSWVKNGCYHEGTVEMMNSNNAICVYLEREEPYYFCSEYKKTEPFYWNNKKWRQLFYCTKEIIVSGKPYPYVNTNLTKTALQILRDLAAKNWNRKYQYGIEEYKDMNHIGSSYRMIVNKKWIKDKKTTKHNIIFDTKGMYNDIFNDHNNQTKYWCVRNKVKKNTIISLSGKAKCLCCMEPIVEDMYDDEYDYDYDYNERFSNTDKVFCRSCSDEDNKICYFCEENTNMVVKTFDGGYYCKNCYDRYIKICPDCGQLFDVTDKNREDLRIQFKNHDNDNNELDYYNYLYKTQRYDCCNDCAKKIITENKCKKVNFYPSDEKKLFPWEPPLVEFYLLEGVYDEDDDFFKRHTVDELESAPFPYEQLNLIS